MAITFLGYVPFYNDAGALMCTVPCFNMGVDFPFGSSLSYATISKSIFDSVFATVNFVVTSSNIRTILDGKSPIHTNKDNGWGIRAIYNLDSEWSGSGYCYYENSQYFEELYVRYDGQGSNPANSLENGIYSIFCFYNNIDVPVATHLRVVNRTDADYARIYGAQYSQYPVQPKFNVDLINYSYIYDENAPENPSDIRELIIKPENVYIRKNSEEEMEAIYRYVSGREVEARDIVWSLYRYEDGYISQYDNISISEDGILSVGETSTQSIEISAFSPSTNLRKDVHVFVELDYAEGGGSFIPNPGNQYYPGGISGPSGIPQGSYDKTFGPNTSALIPGLDSTGQSTGLGGAVGNDISLSGMYTKYLMNQQYLNVLAQLFWEDDVRIQFLKLMFGDPINAIISLISYPFDLASLVDTRSQNIFFGKYDSQMPAYAITRSSFQIDWGTIPIDFYWGNFLDYAPYTQVQLYLPWGVGFVSIDPNEVMPYSDVPNDFNPVNYKRGSIRVVTNIELDKGACVHNVIGNRGLVIGSYGGIVGKQVPMTSLDQSAKTLALVGAATSVGMAAANAMAGAASGKYTSVTPKYSTVGYGNNNWVQSLGFEHKFEGGQMLSDMGGSHAMKAALASAAALFHTPPNYPRAGTFSDATNTMCAQSPYIIISRPSQSVPQNYGHYNGYPSNIYYNKLYMVSGYTEISEIHLDNVPGSVEELEELDSMLKGGVLL